MSVTLFGDVDLCDACSDELDFWLKCQHGRHPECCCEREGAMHWIWTGTGANAVAINLGLVAYLSIVPYGVSGTVGQHYRVIATLSNGDGRTLEEHHVTPEAAQAWIDAQLSTARELRAG